MKYRTLFLIVLTVLFIGWLIILPVSAGYYTNLNVNVYDRINQNDNPGKELPKDYTTFHARVTYVVRVLQTDASGNPTGKYYEKVESVGYYDVSQLFPNAFPHTFGEPYSGGVEKKCWLWFICDYQKTVAYYHIHPVDIPQGYCAMYPDGMDYHKSDTQTVIHKYYRGDACKNGVPADHSGEMHGVIVIR